jgi:hypothetical protein
MSAMAVGEQGGSGREIGRRERPDLEPGLRGRCRGRHHRRANGIGLLIDDAPTRTYIRSHPHPVRERTRPDVGEPESIPDSTSNR